MVCQYCFFNHGFKFKDPVCNGCHDLTILLLNITYIAIMTVKEVDNSCIIHKISKSEVTHLLKNLYWMMVGIYKIHTKKNQYQKSSPLSL